MPADLIVSPAYGRDYASVAEAKADWDADRDFVLHAGTQTTLINKTDFDALIPAGTAVWVRFDKLTEKELLA